MTITPLTTTRVAELAREVVAEFGISYVDTTAAYAVITDTANTELVETIGHSAAAAEGLLSAGCLVGQMLHKHGVPLDTLFGIADETVENLPDEWFADDAARELTSDLQAHQDRMNAWGDVIAGRGL